MEKKKQVNSKVLEVIYKGNKYLMSLEMIKAYNKYWKEMEVELYEYFANKK